MKKTDYKPQIASDSFREMDIDTCNLHDMTAFAEMDDDGICCKISTDSNAIVGL